MGQLDINVIKEELHGLKSSAIILNGSLTMDCCQQLQKCFIKHIKGNDHLRIVVQQTEELDISVLQLFYSLKKTAVKANKKVTFEANLPDDLIKAMDKCGLNIINNQ